MKYGLTSKTKQMSTVTLIKKITPREDKFLTAGYILFNNKWTRQVF